MPYKFNQPRRHKIPTTKYRVTNWPDYDAALVRRGALTVWFTDEAIAEWRAPATGRRGGQPIYSALVREWTAIRAFILVPPVTSSERRPAYPNLSFD
jgi:hypothetical protein